MRILLSNTDLISPAGTQRWVATIAAELTARGHDVAVLTARGNTLYPHLREHRDGDAYDLGILNHNDAFALARRVRMERCVYTAHGFTPEPEWVPPGADAYAAVDELTAAHIPWPATVIRNPVDLEQFAERHPVREIPRSVLLLSNKQGRARPIIEEACSIAGLDLRIVGGPTAVDDPAGPIDEADIVITSGRGVLEALACERNVYVMDFLGAKGYVEEASIRRLRADSYAGLLDGSWPTPEELARHLVDGYDPARRLRGLIAAEHAPAVVVDRYLELARGIGPARRLAGAALRRAGGPLTSRRTTKALSYLRRREPREAWRALRGSQHIPPLLESKLPEGTRVTFPDSLRGPRPELEHVYA